MPGIEEQKSLASFEAGLSELEALIQTLDRDETPLEDMVAGYEKGILLLKNCREKLDRARLRVEMLRENATGEVETVVFEEETSPGDLPAEKKPEKPAPRRKTAGGTDRDQNPNGDSLL